MWLRASRQLVHTGSARANLLKAELQTAVGDALHADTSNRDRHLLGMCRGTGETLWISRPSDLAVSALLAQMVQDPWSRWLVFLGVNWGLVGEVGLAVRACVGAGSRVAGRRVRDLRAVRGVVGVLGAGSVVSCRFSGLRWPRRCV